MTDETPTKPAIQSRTVWLNGVLMICGLMALILDFLSVYDWKLVIAPEWVPVVVLSVNILNIIMRFITTGPVALRSSSGGGW